MVENGTDAVLGAEQIVLQFAHLGSSALAFETLEQGAHARLETHNWMHQWGRHGLCWSTSSFEQSCETDAWRTEHRLYCGQSETQILASCDDVGTFDAQSPYLEQRESDGVGIAGAQRLGGIGLPRVRTSHTGRDESHGYQFD